MSAPATATLDTPFKVTVKLTDHGDVAADGVRVWIVTDKLGADGSDPGISTGDFGDKRFAVLKPGQTKTVVIPITITSKSDPKHFFFGTPARSRPRSRSPRAKNRFQNDSQV